ncbi:outer membrane beta-barrel protein [Flavobacterium silvaticum]|uniref:Outer membrane beta-barrel protein n=1 Tax=Flavobacterium silvaticum TaxID=1852020 RepID=A0A972FN73_9FLAO|nr:outer membrane beta-barrel protein [Flavobacterium silvaticum]NMH28345.1 outer membrane beta-barrel protein [Flavobacterium silvaticum]
MSEKKNIDRLFQERFKDFEIDPPESSWENISERLGNKHKRRILPLWWQRAGVAAILLIGLLLMDQTGGFGSFTNGQDTNVTDRGNAKSNEKGITPGQIQTESIQNQTINRDNAVNGVVDASESLKKNDSDNPDKKLPSGKTIKNNTFKNNSSSAVANTDKNESSPKSVSNRKRFGSKSQKASGVSSDDDNSQVATVGHNGSKKHRSSKAPNKIGSAAVAESGQKTSKGKNRKDNLNNSHENSGIASVTDTNKKNSTTTNANDKKVTDNNTLTQMLAENQKPAEKTKTDSAAIATAESLAMGELLNEKENKSVTEVEQKINRWQVDTHVAPIYLSSLSNGSPIDPEFANNGKEYKTTLSYGVGARYAIGKKVSVRTGINSLAMEYRTTGVTFNQSAFARQQLAHLNSNVQGSYINIESQTSRPAAVNLEGFNINAAQSKTIPGSISQKTGYLEVPLEVTYSVLDKRFGVEVIGGMSTLFLQENDISLISGESEMSIGKADNLNATHFSTNLGLGLYYKIFRNMNFRVEPMVKYQLNAYSDAGNYKPYFFGIYTGLNYRF